MENLLSDPDHRRADMKLIEQAFKQRWEMSPEKKTELMEKLFKIATEDSNATNREIISAARAIIAAEAQNQADEKTATPSQTGQVNVQVNIGNTIQSALNEPDYIEFLRQRALAEDSDPGAVG
jgi:hypothetical protein